MQGVPIKSSLSVCQTVALDISHTALPGHFPGNPVYPGVVLLNYVIQALSLIMKENIVIQEILYCKFLHPVTPLVNSHLDQILQCEFNIIENKVTFSAYSKKQKVLTGILYINKG